MDTVVDNQKNSLTALPVTRRQLAKLVEANVFQLFKKQTCCPLAKTPTLSLSTKTRCVRCDENELKQSQRKVQNISSKGVRIEYFVFIMFSGTQLSKFLNNQED